MLNDIIPAIQKVTLDCMKIGLGGIAVGSGLILQGILIGLLLIPKNEPIKTRGVEQQSHKISNDKISKKFTAADDFSKAKRMLTVVYEEKVHPGIIKAVMRAVLNQ